MVVIKQVLEMQAEAGVRRAAGERLALVPTMGALHEGHLALVRHAGEIADHVTVSIFVNPTQFGPQEDFSRYPRPLDKDLALLRETGVVDAVFVPSVEELYPGGQQAQRTWVVVEELDRRLCGAFRPGHFRGVTTVVTKLFNACRPHVGVFGRKDAQQFLILRRMVEDLNAGVELVGVPTYREADGLAASSRNVYLDPEQRRQAPRLYEALQLAVGAVAAGENRADVLVDLVRRHIEKHTTGRIQYVELVETRTIQPVEVLQPGEEALLALAVFFGQTRLIDNVFL